MKMPKLLQCLRDNAKADRKPLDLVRAEGSTEARLYIYDVIDAWWGVSAIMVANTLANLDASVTTLHVHVNSPGGDVFEGRAIRTHIAKFAGKTVGHIDGLAASAATTVVDGCDEIEIADGAFYMIHNSWTLAWGNKTELRKTAALLQKVDEAIVADYAKRTGADMTQLVAWMDEETWFTADEAVEHGFATRKAELPDKAENSAKRTWNLAAYDKAPKALTEPVQTSVPEPDYEALRAHNLRRVQVLQFA